MLNIVVPMAGRGSRFAEAGYILPKPLIEIHGHSMIEIVTNNVRPMRPHRFIYICRETHIKRYGLKKKLSQIAPGCQIITVDHVTEGAACTVLLAERYIDNDDELMIANSDQYVNTDINVYLSALGDHDGLVMTMPSDDPKWSYICYDENGFITLLREKEVISNQATVGIYNYRKGSDFVRYAKQMIAKDVRVNGEFYVAPVYNEMIEAGKKLVYRDVGAKMFGLGTPADLDAFLALPLSRQVVDTLSE